MRTILTRVVAAAVLASSAVAAQSSGRAFTPEDWYKIARVGGGALSPDGNTLAFTVTTVIEDKNVRHTEVWIQPVAGGTARRMTAPAFESTAPRWSDDGKTLYFTSTRPGSRGNTWAVRMDEGGEAFPVEGAAAAGAGAAAGGRGGRGGRGGNVAAQPADKSFTITAGNGAAGGGRGGAGGGRGGRGGRGDVAESTTVADDPYAKMGPLARPPHGSITKPLNPARFDGRQFIDERTRSNGVGFLPSTGRGGAADSLAALMGGGRGGRGEFLPPKGTPPVQLFIQRGSGERRQITSTNYTHFAPSVSPDGKWVVFSADAKLRSDSLVARERDSVAKLPPNHVRDDADRNETDLYILPVAECEAGNAAACKPKKVDYFGSETNIIWGPDNKQFAFVGHPGQFSSTHLMLATVEGGKAVDLLAAWKYEPGQIEWFKDGKIRMITTTGGAAGLWQVDPATKQVSPILGGASRRRRHRDGQGADEARVHVERRFAPGRVLHVGHQRPERAEAHRLQRRAPEGSRVLRRRAFHVQVGGQPGDRRLADEAVRLSARQEVSASCSTSTAGRTRQYDEGWFDEFQSLAGGGVFVLFTNPRGSSGTNGAFTNASRGDWGGKDYIDLMKGVDWAAARPDVDSTQNGRDRRIVRRVHDRVGRDEDQPLQGRRDRSHDQRLDLLVGRVGRAGRSRTASSSAVRGRTRRCTIRSRRSVT